MMSAHGGSPAMMESAQEYISRTGITDLFQSLTIGLVHDRPDDPIDYLIGCLSQIKSECSQSGFVRWDAFVNDVKSKQADMTSDSGRVGAANGITDESSNGQSLSEATYDVPAVAVWSWEEIIRGRLENLPPLPSNIVRIFLSSTFSDFKAERTVLPRYAYPQLQHFCSKKGLDFQVVDMRWGVTDEMVSDHMTSSICLREITLCQQLSQGPCFVAMLGHRYGYQPLPASIDVVEFEIIHSMAKANMMDGIALLKEWYIRDDNSRPPEYCLQPITDKIPNFNNPDPDKNQLQADAKIEWSTIFMSLQSVLRRGVVLAVETKLLPEERKHAYFMSVTEEEIQKGILMADTVIDRSLCYVRQLDGIKNVPLNSPILTRYLDILEKDKVDETAQELLEDLVTEKIPTKISQENYKEYKTTWTGVPLESFKDNDHRVYLDLFCSDFVEDIKKVINQKACDTTQNVPDDLKTMYLEVLHHSKFCLKKCEVFCGQEEVLQQVRVYTDNLGEPHLPLIIHGKSGYGKTSLLAQIGKTAQQHLNGIQTTIVRFLGTSPTSSSIQSTLLSLMTQLCVIYKMSSSHLDQLERMSDIRREFWVLLEVIGNMIDPSERLLVLLDSIDQLSRTYGSHKMHWLPRRLPPNVGIILSMLSDRYDCFAATKSRISEEKAFIELKELSPGTGEDIMEAYLSRHNRSLISAQKASILRAFSYCQQPLFLKLLLDEARTWKSYSKPSGIHLVTSINAAINRLFHDLEDKFGMAFVRSALAYLTCGKDGLTGIEIEDVLSCDDQVLNDVYAFHDPPLSDIVRIPPLLWARLQHEVSEYLVERTADGKTVMGWYHRLFWESAEERFVQPQKRRLQIHCRLADIFKADTTVKKTIVLQKRNNLTMADADRQISPQPLSVFNLRKLNALPYHLYHSKRLEELRSVCLLDFHWLLTKLRAGSVRDLVAELEVFCSTEPLASDEVVCIMKDFIQLAYEPLKDDANQLAYQALERLNGLSTKHPTLAKFLEDAKNWTQSANCPLLLPVHPTNLKSPESALKYSVLAGNSGIVSRSEDIAVCGFLEKQSGKFKVQVWNLTSKDIVESIPSKHHNIYTISGDSSVLVLADGYDLKYFDTASGDLLGEIKYRHQRFPKIYAKALCVDEKGRHVIVGTKVGEKTKGSGIRYRSDIHLVDLETRCVRQSLEYSAPGSRCLEQIAMHPNGDTCAVIDYSQIVMYQTDNLKEKVRFKNFTEVKADTFSFTDDGNWLVGSYGGYTNENARIVALHLPSGDIETSEALFDLSVRNKETGHAEQVSLNDGHVFKHDDKEEEDDDDEEEEETEITRTFALIPNINGAMSVAGVSSIGKGRRNCVVVWNKQNGDIKQCELPLRTERFPKCLSVFPDWTTAVVGWDDGLMMFVHLGSMTHVWQMKAHEMSVNVIQILPESGVLVSIGTDRNLKVWDLRHLQAEVSRARRDLEVDRPVGEPKSAQLDENEQVVAFCCTDSVVVTALPYPSYPPKVWSVHNAEFCKETNQILEGEYLTLYPDALTIRKDVSLAFIQAERYLIDVRRRRAEAVAHVIDTQEGGKVVCKFDTFNPHLISKDKYFLASTMGQLQVRELPGGDLVQTVTMSLWPEELEKDHVNSPPLVALTVEDKYFVFVNLTGSDKYLEIVDMDSFTVVCKSQILQSVNYASFVSLLNGLTYLTIHDSTNALITLPGETAGMRTSRHTYQGMLSSNSLSIDQELGVTLQDDNTFTLWNTRNIVAVYTSQSQSNKIHCVRFSPNSRYLVTGSYTMVAIWSIQEGQLVHKLQTYGAVCGLSFTPNGKYLLVQCYAAPKRKRLIIHRTLHMT